MRNYSSIGSKKKSSGDFFENLILRNLEEYRLQNIADIRKIHVEKKFINGKIIYSEKTNVDFVGYTTQYHDFKYDLPVHVGIEAKQISGDYFSFSNLKYHQIDYLLRLNNLGGIALLCIGFIDHNRIFVIKVNQKFMDILGTEKYNKGKTTYTKGISIKNILNLLPEKLVYDMYTYTSLNLLGVV